MNVVSLLNQLAKQDIRLWLEQGQLRYNAPEGAMTADIIQQLKAAKADIIQFLQQAENQQTVIPEVDRQQALPVSSAQQRFWLLQQLDPSSSAFHIHTALEIKGALDAALLEQACLAVIQNQAILRTRYYQQQGKLYQAIEETSSWRLEQEVIAAEQLDAAIAAEKSLPFDLARAPVFRCKLFNMSSQHAVLSFTVHHIAADGWSLGIFVQEMVQYYQALAQQQPLSMRKLERQYADFAYWQQSQERQQQIQQQLSYWVDELRGVENLDLPTKVVRQANTESSAASYSWQLSSDVFSALNKRYQGTLFTSSMAVFSLLLQRYSGQNDFCIGTPVAGRSAASALESIIGCFINVLAIRCEPDKELSVNEHFTAIKQSCEQALSQQDAPFEQIIQKLQLKPDLSNSPVFQVMLAVQNAPFNYQPLPNLDITQYPDKDKQAQYDLTLFVQESDSNIYFTLEYKTALFDAAFIQRMAEHFNHLAEQALNLPEQAISTLALSSQTQQAPELVGQQKKLSEISLLTERFAELVNTQGQQIAVKHQEQSISYQELAQQANNIAAHLYKQGVKAGDFVGICLQREPQLLASILAILQLGAAYVPLDPSLPKERLQYILQDSQTKVCVTATPYLAQIEGAAKLLCLDNLPPLSEQAINFPAIQADDLAYLLYTSGSTGQPKGTMIEHLGLANYLNYAAKQYLTSTAGAVVSSTINFDATITSLLAPLYAGKTVALTASDDEEFEQLAEAIFASKENLLFKITPAHLDFLYHKHSHRRSEQAHIFIVGGEQLLVSQAKRWLEQLTPKAVWVNEYGPTETVVGCSTFFFTQQTLNNLTQSAVPIGKPIQNTDLLILDEDGHAVPQGIPGELYIASLGVGKGYLNLAEQTRQNFLAHQHPLYTRLYKTGDKVRLLDNGELLYLGRLDQQVKIRGQRLELSEIEAILLQHTGIQSAVVDIREHQQDKRLIAWYQSKETIATNELKQALAKKLPTYMLPSQFVAVHDWPLTHNGKINRHRLPEPDWQDLNRQNYVAPSTETEAKLAAIWQQILSLENIGIHDNFFDIGGHSLTAAEALALAQQDFDVQIPLRQLFENPTIEAIAKSIDEALLAEKILHASDDAGAMTEETESFML